MSNADVIPFMRAVGWNVHFAGGEEENPAFAGIYQAVGSELVTFRDVRDELRLCFEIPKDEARSTSGGNADNNNDNNDHDQWAGIAFALTSYPDSSSPPPSFVTQAFLDQPVPSLPPLRPKKQNVIRYHVVFHAPHCDLSPDSPLDAHLQGQLVLSLESFYRLC
jgi:hypothetical protein